MFCSSGAGAGLGVFWKSPPGAAAALTGCGAGLNSRGARAGAGAGVGAVCKGAFWAAVTLVGCGAGFSSCVDGAVNGATEIKALGLALRLENRLRDLGKGCGRR